MVERVEKNGITHICGSFIVQANGAFLNGAGNIKAGLGEISVPKTYILRGFEYPYISAQCWRRWWRESFTEDYMKIESYMNETKYSKVPFLNGVDDLFGYFESFKKEISIDEINEINISQIRSSPLQISNLHPIEGHLTSLKKILTTDNAFIHLSEGTPLPYSSNFYNCNLECLFSLDIVRICTYRNFNDRQELAKETIKDYFNKKLLNKKNDTCYELIDRPFLMKIRISNLFNSLLNISGGAKSAQYGTDITPKVIIFAGQTGSNPILSQVFEIGRDKIRINLDSLTDRIKKFPSLFKSSIYIGIRNSFLENIEEIQKQVKLIKEKYNVNIILGSPRNVINEFIEDEFNA